MKQRSWIPRWCTNPPKSASLHEPKGHALHGHDVVAASQDAATRMSTWRANYPSCYSRNNHMALTKEWLHALLANPAAVSSVTRIQDFPSLCSFRFYPNFDGMLTFLEFSYASPHMFTQLSRFARFLAASFTHHGRLRLAAGLFIPFGGQYFSSSCARKEVLPCCRAWIPARRSEGTYRASCEESNVWLGSARLHDGWPHSTKMKKPSVW